jgi:hypothetical protein
LGKTSAMSAAAGGRPPGVLVVVCEVDTGPLSG